MVEAAEITRSIPEVLRNPNVYLLAEEDPKEILREISKIQLRLGLKDIFLLRHRPSIRAFPSFYGPIIERLEVAAISKIGTRLRYEKFKSEELRILLVHSGYLLMGELINAIRLLGYRMDTIFLEKEAEVARNEFVEDLLRTVMEFRPDFVLTINHMGFDREGIVTDLLTTLEIPFASWFVDSPMLIVRHYRRNISPYCAIFLWDSDYIKDIKELGFDKVHYLPLGSDPQTFTPMGIKKNSMSSRHIVSFVGNSMVGVVQERIQRLAIPQEQMDFIEELAIEYAKSGARNTGDILDLPQYAVRPLVKKMNNGRRLDFEALIMWKSTQLHRLGYVEMLEPFLPVVRGDKGWNKLLGRSFQIGPELSYYRELNSFYNASKINFNVTSTQMRNAVNQRVFDVPASGGFLLTDYKEQLEDLMHVGTEVVCYRDKEEIPELIRFYLGQDDLREKIAQRARKRVLAEHTYVHRLEELCRLMRDHFQGAC